MNSKSTFKATFLAVAITFTLAGCSDSQEEMSQEEIQYISHLDQSRFFQRQGELKSSTLEARKAIELQPERTDPYFVILNNLLTAGDAVTTERQLNNLLENLPESSRTPEVLNQARIIRAEAEFMQGDTEAALDALNQLESPDRVHQHQALLLKGRTFLAAGRLQEAEKAFREAKDLSDSSVSALIGLSKVAWQQDNPEEARQWVAEAEQLSPQSSELWLWKAQMAMAGEKWQIAEEAYIQAMDEIGRYDIMTYQKYETISSLVRALREQGKAAEAFVYEEILAKSAPGTIKSNLTAAQKAFENGDYNAATNYLEEVLNQAPGSEQARLMLGMIKFRQGRFEEAEALIGPVANLGDSEAASKLVAASRLQMRDPEGAQAILEGLDSRDSDPSVIAMAGIASLATGDKETGETLIREAIKLRPNHSPLRLRFARYLLEDNRPQEALAELDAVLENEPDSIPARALSIQSLLRANRNEEAVAAADQWVSENPQELAALMMRGNLAANLENYGTAITLFERAAETHPESTQPLIALGQTSLAQQDRSKAREYFTAAARLNPNSIEAFQGFSIVSEPEELLNLAESVAKDNPDATAPKLFLLEAALNEGNDSRADELTANLLERSEENRPAPAADVVATIYSRIASRQRENDEIARADSILERGRALFPDNEDIALQAAVVKFDLEKTAVAREILTEIKAFSPESPRPYIVEARHLADQGETAQASELYSLALEKGAGAQTRLELIRLHQTAGLTDEALETAQEALKAHPDNQAIAVASAMLYQQTGQADNAISAYENVLRLNPDNPLALNNLAWMYFEKEDSRALGLAKKAYERAENNAAIADTYGWILFNSGDVSGSVQILEQAHSLDPQSQEIALHLAESYRATGQNDKAKELLMKFEPQD